MTITQKPYLTPAEAAAYLGTTKNTLATLRCRGGGPAFLKIGGHRIVYSVEHLEAYMREKAVVKNKTNEVGVSLTTFQGSTPDQIHAEAIASTTSTNTSA